MSSTTVREMPAREIHWEHDGENLVSEIGRIEKRGHLYDALPGGDLGHLPIPTRVVGLLDVRSAVVWFEQICESLGVDVVIDHPERQAA